MGKQPQPANALNLYTLNPRDKIFEPYFHNSAPRGFEEAILFLKKNFSESVLFTLQSKIVTNPFFAPLSERNRFRSEIRFRYNYEPQSIFQITVDKPLHYK